MDIGSREEKKEQRVSLFAILALIAVIAYDAGTKINPSETIQPTAKYKLAINYVK